MSVRSSLYYRRGAGGKVAIEDMGVSTGKRIFVHSVTGVDGTAYGFTPDKPYATLDYAIGKCTANKGDIIYLMPGHSEAIATSLGCVLDVAGVQVIGLGHGSLQPLFTLGTATTATISVTAADCRIRNIKVLSGLADVAAGITLAATATGTIVEDCLFMDGGLTVELKIAISIAALCSNVIVRRCRFFSDMAAATGATTAAIKTVGAADYLRIEDCFSHGHYSGANFDLSAAASLSIYIRGNALINIDTDAGLTMSNNAGDTGFVIENDAAGIKDTVHLAGAALAWSRNYDSNALGASAIIKPAVDS
jgi:hypothetical protein